jgi:hypothetical protein
MILVVGTVVYNRSIIITNLTELRMQPTIHLERKGGQDAVNIQLYLPNVLWVAFSNPSGSLSLVKYPIYISYISFSKDLFFHFKLKLSWNIEPSTSKKKHKYVVS